MTFAEIRDNQGRIPVNLLITSLFSLYQYCSLIEKFGEQYTVVFASVATKPSAECVCVWGGGEVIPLAHRLNMEVDL